MIQRRLEAGIWRRLWQGVYCLAGTPPSWHQTLFAACLGAGVGAVASYDAAGELHLMPGVRKGQLEITAARDRRLALSGVRVHQSLLLPRVDTAVTKLIPVTSPARTLIDLAGRRRYPSDVVEEMLDDLLRRGMTSLARLRWRLEALSEKGRPGIALIRSLVASRRPAELPESVLERRTLRLFDVLEGVGLPRPVCQHNVRDRGRVVARVDFAYPELRLALEADGYTFHSGRRAFDADRKRRNLITSLGWTVLQITWTDVMECPDHVADLVSIAYARRLRELGDSRSGEAQ